MAGIRFYLQININVNRLDLLVADVQLKLFKSVLASAMNLGLKSISMQPKLIITLGWTDIDFNPQVSVPPPKPV